MPKTSLLKLNKNTKARIAEILGGPGIQHKMMSMGIYPGKEIIKLSHISLRGPVTIKIGRSHIAFGHGMASRIMVETE